MRTQQKAHYRKHNDRSLNSSTYHKKDGTNVRAILKRETMKGIEEWEECRHDGLCPEDQDCPCECTICIIVGQARSAGKARSS